MFYTSVFQNHLKHEHIINIGIDLNILDDIETTDVKKREEVTEIFVLTQFTRIDKKIFVNCV